LPQNSAPGWSHSEASRGTNQEGDGQISQQWSTSRVFFKLSPTPNLDLVSEYTRIHKDGQRPFGMAFGSPGGIFLELVQPIDQTIHEFRTRGTYATDLAGGINLPLRTRVNAGLTRPSSSTTRTPSPTCRSGPGATTTCAVA
jgi:hypothetical protein